MKIDFEFDMLDVVRDTITGVEGVVTGACVYHDNRMHYCVEKVLTNIDQTPVIGWFDGVRLEAV